MVNDLQSQINNSFSHLLSLLAAESKANEQASQFLRYVKEKQSLLQDQSASQTKDIIRGINRYSDEFEFTATNSGKIKSNINALYDLANQLAQ